jgi:hypothetical protein
MISLCLRSGGQGMLFSRNGVAPRIDQPARVAPAATVVGDVTIGAGCYVDYGAVIAALDRSDQEQLHREAAARLREEAEAWTDELVAEPVRRIDSEG